MTKLLPALLLLAACHDRVIAVQPPPPAATPGQMTVTGSAHLDVSPDCADLTLTLSSEAPRAGTAGKDVDRKEHGLVDALGKLGLEASDLKLSTLSLVPVFEQRADGTWTDHVRAYRAELTIVATTHDFGKIGDIMEAASDAGATGISSQFRRSDLPELKKKVRTMALAAAKEKAVETAAALGIKLGRVTLVGETPNGVMWSNTYFPNAAATEDRRVALGGTLQPLTLDVSVTYELARET